MRIRNPYFFSGENFRFIFLIGFFLFFFLLVLLKLFVLQVIQGEELQKKSKEIRQSSVEISARRGGIFTRDSKTGEIAPLAINTTLYKVFVDAREKDQEGNTLTPESNLLEIAKFLTENLYTQEEFLKCQENTKWCPEGSVVEIKDEKDVVIHRTFPTYKYAKQMFEQEVLKKISERKTSLIYATEVHENILRQIEQQSVPNVFVSLEKKHVRVELETLSEAEKNQVAELLKKFFGGDKNEIIAKLKVDRKGYVLVMSRVRPEIREKILQEKEKDQKKYLVALAHYQKMKKSGLENITPPQPPILQSIGFRPDPLRYYPENSLMANVVGFVANNRGEYGIEKYLDTFLRGEDGVFESSRDVNGNLVTIQENDAEQVIDGGDVVLTIDRILQQRVEKILDEKMEEYEADSAQAILMNPQNGEILVMANSPRFDPNFFGDVYARRRTIPEDIESVYKTTPLERKDREENFVPVKYKEFEQAWELGFDPEFYVFENDAGPAAYQNKIISTIYEPGSTIKPLVMAAALEEGEITPSSTYFESAPLEVGEFTIRNSDGAYLGSQTMTNIIERSANLGMAFIAEKMGKPLLYDSLKKMGFGEYTDISLPDELSGDVKYYKKWSDAHMYNAAFGQGFSATSLQVIQAWGALANGGFLIAPKIVTEFRSADGKVETKDENRKRIFSSDTVEEMKNILVSSTENGVAKYGRVRGHYIAGKTGTSQIARTDGVGYEDLNEVGSTITSFIGFAPVDDPQYLLLVKFDRPRKAHNGRAVYGSSTAAPTFAEIMNMVFFYYDTPMDKF